MKSVLIGRNTTAYKAFNVLRSLFMALSLFCSHAFAIDIIAHRGASGFVPEHTKEALVLSFMQGAHYIEQDLVLSADKQLIVLHDIHLEHVTNVESVFPKRAREDGRFYVIDFTLEELRRLSIHERENADGTRVFDSRYRGNAHFSMTTFAEHVELIGELNRAFNKDVGLYPEIKAPNWHKQQGADITKVFMDELNALGLNNKHAKLYVQSFDPVALKRIDHEFKSELKLIQLIAENDWNESDTDYDVLKTPSGLAHIATYADGIGPWLPQVYSFDTKQATGLIQSAHREGLLVHPYTFRTDVIKQTMQPKEAFNLLKNAQIDGLFTDQIMGYMTTPNISEP
jgi:glycerophosphoryl diester phosphodiesterase